MEWRILSLLCRQISSTIVVFVEFEIEIERMPRAWRQGVDASPRYIVVGGLVFVPLSVPFMMHHFGCNRTHFPAHEIRPR